MSTTFTSTNTRTPMVTLRLHQNWQPYMGGASVTVSRRVFWSVRLNYRLLRNAGVSRQLARYATLEALFVVGTDGGGMVVTSNNNEYVVGWTTR